MGNKKWSNKLYKQFNLIISKETPPRKKIDILSSIQQYILCSELRIY